MTKEISLRFQGKWKTTQIIEPIIQTVTVSEVTTSVKEVMPTHSLKQPSFELPHHLNFKAKENRIFPELDERKENKMQFKQISRSAQRQTSFLPTPSPTRRNSHRLDNFKSLQARLSNIRLHRNKNSHENYRKHLPDKKEIFDRYPKENTRVNDQISEMLAEENSIQTTKVQIVEKKPLSTVSTLYISGSVPGVFTTSLTTIILEKPVQRKRRGASSLVPKGSIKPTKVYSEPDIYKNKEYCPIETVTITIMKDGKC